MVWHVYTAEKLGKLVAQLQEFGDACDGEYRNA